jgi:peptidoglycan-N-acetylglucosamine deacetylase
MQYLYNPPLAVKMILRDSSWNSSVDKVLFTFDDGPLAGNTEIILKKLQQYNIKAVFFCVGNNVIENPGIISAILQEGHHIGNHTMNHKVLNRSDINEITGEVIPLNSIMYDQFGYTVKYFRPPYGRISLRLNTFLKENKLKNIMWSLLTYDYKNDLSKVKKSLKHIKSNSIIVFHDNYKCKDIISDAIDYTAEKISSKNYIYGQPEECLK